jgi:hypothetical protein
MKLVTQSYTLPEDLIEQLRKFSYINRINKSKIIRDALNFYFKHPESKGGER